jgi:protein SCO1/2
MSRFLAPSLLFFAIVGVGAAQGQSQLPAQLRDIGIDQRLNEQVPLDLVFRDETGRSVHLGDYFRDKPVILVLAYYRCPMLCTLVLNGLVQALLDVPFDPGKDFQIVTVSFDPREAPEMARAKKKTYVERYGRPGAAENWHFLTGEEEAIKQFTQAVGFRYRYDDKEDQFIHASGIMLTTPHGKLARYFYGVNFNPRDLRLGLVEAAGNKIGGPVEQILLFCFHYDPSVGKYSTAILNIVRLGGVLTVLAIVFMVGAFLWQERRRSRNLATAE